MQEGEGYQDLETSGDSGEASNSCILRQGHYEGKFVSPNVVNLSLNKAKIKEGLEDFGRKLRLMWFFRNDDRETIINPFQKKSKFNPKRNDASIEIYLSRLEEEFLNIDTNINYSNLTKEERKALYSLRDDTSIVIKEADQGSAVVVWDREDYLAKAGKQLDDKNVYKKVTKEVEGSLEKTIKGVLGKVRKRGDISDSTFD